MIISKIVSFGLKFDRSAKNVVEKARKQASLCDAEKGTDKYTKTINNAIKIIEDYMPQNMLSIKSEGNVEERRPFDSRVDKNWKTFVGIINKKQPIIRSSKPNEYSFIYDFANAIKKGML